MKRLEGEYVEDETFCSDELQYDTRRTIHNKASLEGEYVEDVGRLKDNRMKGKCS